MDAEQAEPTVDDLIRGLLAKPLPTFDDPYVTALATIQDLEGRLALARVWRDLDPEKFAAVTTDLTAQLSVWQSRRTAATEQKQAEMARSEAMRPSTGGSVLDRPLRDREAVFVGGRVRRVHRHNRRPRCGRPATRRRGSRRGTPAPSRAGPEAGDPEPAGPGAPVGDTSRAVHNFRTGAGAHVEIALPGRLG